MNADSLHVNSISRTTELKNISLIKFQQLSTVKTAAC